MTLQGVQPIFILPEGSQRTTGKNAQRVNIEAAKQVADTVRTTLGPKGMDKMLVDSLGDVVVTNDGVTILQEMNIEHPSAKMIVEIAKTQENEVGDGTTTAVVLAGELLKNAETLLDQNIHPTNIVKGYRLAAEQAQKILNNISEKINEKQKDILKKIVITAMTGKGAEASKEKLADMIVDAVIQIAEKQDNKLRIDKDNIKVEKKTGAGIEDSELIQGIIVDKEIVHPAMPKSIKNAKVLLLDTAIEVKNPENDAKIQINDPDKLTAFLEHEEETLRDMVNKIAKSNANVVFCQKGIDDLAQHFLAKKEILAVRRVKKSDIEKLSKATGAKIVSSFDELSETDLGLVGSVEEKKVGDENMVFVTKCKNPKAVTLLIRGGTEHVVDEIKRAIDDAIGDLISSLEDGKVIAGAGAIEIELAKQLRNYSESLSGREQLAVNKFAESIEVIPRTLAENAGLDPIDILTSLKAEHDKGNRWAGIDVFSGKVIDAWKQGIIEPLRIKTQAVKSASEVATMILRIDDVIAGGSSKNSLPQPSMPGMGGGMPY